MKSLIKNVASKSLNTTVEGVMRFNEWARQNPKKATAIVFVAGCAEGMMWNKTLFKKFYNKHPKSFTLITVIASAGYSAKYYNHVTRFQLKLEPLELPVTTLAWKTEIK